MLLNSGEIGAPCGVPFLSFRARFVRRVPPSPSLSRVARSGVSERSPTLLDSRQWSCPCLLSVPFPAQGPFPRRALPRVSGTTDPSATLPARPAPRGVPVAACTAPAGLPVLLRFPSSMHADAITPAENRPVLSSLSSQPVGGLPLMTGGSASALTVSRPARRSLAFRPAWSLNRPRRPFSPKCFSPCRYLHEPLWPLPAEATVAGWDSHPPGKRAFPRRTVTSS